MEERGEVEGLAAAAVVGPGGFEVVLEILGRDAIGLKKLGELAGAGGIGTAGGLGGTGAVLAVCVAAHVDVLEHGGDGILDGLIGILRGIGILQCGGDGGLDLALQTVVAMMVVAFDLLVSVAIGVAAGIVRWILRGLRGGDVHADAVCAGRRGLKDVVEINA